MLNKEEISIACDSTPVCLRYRTFPLPCSYGTPNWTADESRIFFTVKSLNQHPRWWRYQFYLESPPEQEPDQFFAYHSVRMDSDIESTAASNPLAEQKIFQNK